MRRYLVPVLTSASLVTACSETEPPSPEGDWPTIAAACFLDQFVFSPDGAQLAVGNFHAEDPAGVRARLSVWPVHDREAPVARAPSVGELIWHEDHVYWVFHEAVERGVDPSAPEPPPALLTAVKRFGNDQFGSNLPDGLSVSGIWVWPTGDPQLRGVQIRDGETDRNWLLLGNMSSGEILVSRRLPPGLSVNQVYLDPRSNDYRWMGRRGDDGTNEIIGDFRSETVEAIPASISRFVFFNTTAQSDMIERGAALEIDTVLTVEGASGRAPSPHDVPHDPVTPDGAPLTTVVHVGASRTRPVGLNAESQALIDSFLSSQATDIRSVWLRRLASDSRAGVFAIVDGLGRQSFWLHSVEAGARRISEPACERLIAYTSTAYATEVESGAVHAIVHRPLEAERQPVTVYYLHGGPQAHSGDAIGLMGRAFLHHGATVVEINYAGSTGYGAAHVERGRDAFDTAMRQDIIAAVTAHRRREAAAEQGLELLAGGSAGGFLAWQAAAQGDIAGLDGLLLGNTFMDADAFYSDPYWADQHAAASQWFLGPPTEAGAERRRRVTETIADWQPDIPIVAFISTSDERITEAQRTVMAAKVELSPGGQVIPVDADHSLTDMKSWRVFQTASQAMIDALEAEPEPQEVTVGNE